MQKEVLILGINGGFGALFSRLLFEHYDLSITGVDLHSLSPSTNSRCNRYISADVRFKDEELISATRRSEIIIICLPENVAYKFLGDYSKEIPISTLLVDTLSIKTKIALIYRDNDFNALSLNPMFGPDLSTEGKNIAVMQLKEAVNLKWFVSVLYDLKFNLTFLTFEEHDRLTAFVQSVTHAVILAFGSTLKDSEFQMDKLLSIATPPFSSLNAIFNRICAGSGEMYWAIQHDNPYAAEARKLLVRNLISLDKNIIKGNQNYFDEIIKSN